MPCPKFHRDRFPNKPCPIEFRDHVSEFCYVPTPGDKTIDAVDSFVRLRFPVRCGYAPTHLDRIGCSRVLRRRSGIYATVLQVRQNPNLKSLRVYRHLAPLLSYLGKVLGIFPNGCPVGIEMRTFVRLIGPPEGKPPFSTLLVSVR